MSDKIRLSVKLPVSPNTLYNAWFDKDKHSAFSSGKADIEKKVGYKFTACDGYIEGSIKQMILSKKIVMNWRTTDFPEGCEDSLVTLDFEKLEDLTKLVVIHENLPENDGKKYRKSWKDNYFNYMKEFFK